MVAPQSFGAKAPMMPGRNPIVQGKMAPPPPVAFTSNNPAIAVNSANRNSSSTTSHNFAWKVEALPQVPIYHPLERTAVTFGDEDPSLDVITQRISNFMKDESIFCNYQDARVVCSTSACLHFSVQLWQKNGNTVMEIQRKQGCSIRMQSLRQRLKDCILFDEDITSKTQDQGDCPPSLKQQLARMVPAVPASEQQGCCMELCQKMLSSNLVDQNRMGLESLCILTDASKVQDATTPSDKVLLDSNLQMSLLQYFASAADDLHLLALKALTQALEASASSSKMDLKAVFWQTVLQALYQHIQRPHERPLEAAYAIKAVRLLSAKCPECLEILQRQHSLPVTAFLQIAHEFGKQHSASLEQEALQFLNVH